MNTNFISLGGGNYVTPEIKSLEIKSEGVLCASDMDAQDWKTGTNDWFE